MSQSPERLQQLVEFSLGLHSSLELQDVSQRAITDSVSMTGARRGVLMLRDMNGQIRMQAQRDFQSSSAEDREFDVVRLAVEQVVQDGHAWMSERIANPAICVPLQWAEDRLGAIYVDRQARDESFSHEDLEILSAMAPLAANSIVNSLRFEQAARSADELRRLYDTSLDISSQLEIGKLLDLIISRAARLLNGESGNFYFYHSTHGELRPTSPYGNHTTVSLRSLKPGEGATGKVFVTGKPVVVQDYDSWEGRSPQIPYGRYARILHVPVKRGSEVVGVMSVNRSKLMPPFDDDDVRLLLLFASQAAIAIENARLYQVAIEKASLERELHLAAEVQANLLPREIPHIQGWDFAVHWQPARQVSGDFYDFVRLEDGRLAFVIGDVSGNGVPAALLMASVRAFVRASIGKSVSPGRILERVNDLICPDIPARTFVTAFCAILSPETGHLVYSNAGHALPYLKQGLNLLQLQATGVPLGLLPSIGYDEKEMTIRAQESLLFYSDGLVEVHNPQREMYGFRRLTTVLEQPVASSVLIKSLLDQLAVFAGPDWEQEDDITLVTFKRSQ